MTTISVTESVKDRITQLSKQHGVSTNILLKALLDTLNSPYNKSLLEHIIRIHKAERKFDTSKSEEEKDEAYYELQNLAKKSADFV